MEDAINIMVVGECGDGKSTLINALRDQSRSEQALCGKNPSGVTKDIVMYPCPDINGKPFNILDTPGVGDHHVTPVALISMIEEFLMQGVVPGGVRGVVVTTPVPDGRVKLGAQIVQAIVDKGFVAPAGEDKYGNIILCGTKLDKADDEEKQNFLEGLAGGPSVRGLFFEQSVNKTGPCVMVHKDDYSPLLEAICQLPVLSIAYEKPQADVMAQALAAKLGMRPEELESQMNAMRQIVEEQSKQLKELLQEMHESQQRHRQEMAKKDEMIQEMLKKMQEDQAKAEVARQERERQLEQMRKEQDEQRRAEQQASADLQQKLLDQMQAESAKAQKQLENFQKQKEEADRKHQDMLLKMQKDHQEAMKDARESGGGGCFPASTILETPSGPRRISELQVGDKVLAVDSKGRLCFDDIYFWGHAEAKECHSYICLHTKSRQLHLSARHFVALAGGAWDSRFVYAEDVRLGDTLWVLAEDRLVREVVLDIQTRKAEGLYNPYTLTGTLVADGVAASAHSDWLLDDFCPRRCVGVLPAIYQAVLLPGRLLYRVAGRAAANALDVNNPQSNFATSIGTSPSALAFLVACAIVPVSVSVTGMLLHNSSF